MRISRVKLNNYVCFYDEDAEWVELGPGINFVVGKNNSGKTAFLDALTLGLERSAHRSTKNNPNDGYQPESWSEPAYNVTFDFTHLEVKDYVRNSRSHNRSRVDIPVLEPISLDNYPMSRQLATKEIAQVVETYIASLVGKGISIDYIFRNNRTSSIEIERFGSDKNGGVLSERIQFLHLSIDDRQQFDWQVSARQSHSVRDAVTTWGDILGGNDGKIFRFQSDRMVESSCSPDEFFELKSDASNLPQVLHSLKNGNEFRFGEYLQLVQSVQSEIRQVLTPVREGEVTIEISQYDPSQELVDLVRPLSECGSGVSHILAILYVVAFHDESQPRVIIIDEPHSFLHPGAVRQLLKIFEEHDHHQYIIATHSPTAIMAVKKKRILLVQREDMVSTVKSVEVDDNESLEEALREIGSKRSDIFGMDAVIWVEGKTDETCFKLIMDKVGDGLPFGTNISALVNTGDLEGKQRYAELAVQIYQSLSGGVGLLPSVLAFVFDGDKQGEHNRLKNTGYRIKYLQRQNYESYLIAPDILAEILNRDASEDKCNDHTADSIATWIREKEGRDYNADDWLKTVDGANLLDCMFNDLAGISYKDNKVAYGEEITKRILESDSDHFSDIVKLINCILSDDSTH